MSYKSYAFTIRPLKGVTDKLEQAVIKYLERQPYAFAVIEMEDEARHIHGQIWYDVAIEKGTLNKALERICSREVEEWTASQTHVLRRGTKIAYSDDFIDNYLAKEDNIIFNNPPEDSGGYYPSEEEQNKVKSLSNAVDKKFHKLEQQYKEWNEKQPPSRKWDGVISKWHNLRSVSLFYMDAMFNSKTIMVVTDKKKRTETAKSLYLYIKSSVDVRECMTKEDYAEASEELESYINM